MRYAAALVLLVFAIGCAGAGADSLTECRDSVERGDYDAAVTSCTRAAEQGDAEAQYDLGVMYAEAQYDLGVMYALGEGVPKDYVRAFMWLNLAAAQGVEKAAKAKDKLRGRMTSEQIAKAQRLSTEWSEKFKAKQDGD